MVSGYIAVAAARQRAFRRPAISVAHLFEVRRLRADGYMSIDLSIHIADL